MITFKKCSKHVSNSHIKQWNCSRFLQHLGVWWFLFIYFIYFLHFVFCQDMFIFSRFCPKRFMLTAKGDIFIQKQHNPLASRKKDLLSMNFLKVKFVIETATKSLFFQVNPSDFPMLLIPHSPWFLAIFELSPITSKGYITWLLTTRHPHRGPPSTT